MQCLRLGWRCVATLSHPGCLGQRTKVSSVSFFNEQSYFATLLTSFLGNVTYECPGIQAYVGVPAAPGANNHTAGFTAVAGTKESHDLCIHAAKGMAISGLQILKSDELAERIKLDFEEDKKTRGLPSMTRMFDRNAGFC